MKIKPLYPLVRTTKDGKDITHHRDGSSTIVYEIPEPRMEWYDENGEWFCTNRLESRKGTVQ